MANFIGDHTCKLDAKGRLLLPSAIKKQMDPGQDEKFVVKKDIYDDCLVLYPMDEWERQVNYIREKVNPYNKEHNRLLRGFYKGTAEVSLDANNRLLIPKRLLDLIRADRELILAGQHEKIEIWVKEKYDEVAEDGEEYAELATKILGGNNQNND
jgi:MraZ protein